MNTLFADTLKKLRAEKGLSQNEYSFDARETGAIGFMLKPLTPEGVKKQLEKLRYPFRTGGEDA